MSKNQRISGFLVKSFIRFNIVYSGFSDHLSEKIQITIRLFPEIWDKPVVAGDNKNQRIPEINNKQRQSSTPIA